jgi:YVTN family beta-propeller protein
MFKPLRTLALLLLPISALAQETMLVVQKGDDSVGLYDAAGGAPLARIAVGTKPHEVVLSADEKLAYVTNYGIDRWTETVEGGRSITIVDLSARRVAGEIDLGPFRRPHGIARGRSGRLYVTCDFPPSLLVIDPQARRVERHVDVGQSLPHMVVVTPDERKAYTANSGSGSVSAIDLAEGKVVAQVPIGGVPMGFALAGDGRRLYAANRTGDAVAVIDTASDAVVDRLAIAGNPARLRLLPGDRQLLVSLIEAGAVAVVDVAGPAPKEVHRFPVGRHAEGLGLDPAGGFGYVSAQDDARVIKFSLRDWQIVLAVETGRRPDPIVILHP